MVTAATIDEVLTEFCKTVGSVTRTALMLTQLVRCWLFIEPAIWLTFIVSLLGLF